MIFIVSICVHQPSLFSGRNLIAQWGSGFKRIRRRQSFSPLDLPTFIAGSLATFFRDMVEEKANALTPTAPTPSKPKASLSIEHMTQQQTPEARALLYQTLSRGHGMEQTPLQIKIRCEGLVSTYLNKGIVFPDSGLDPEVQYHPVKDEKRSFVLDHHHFRASAYQYRKRQPAANTGKFQPG